LWPGQALSVLHISNVLKDAFFSPEYKNDKYTINQIVLVVYLSITLYKKLHNKTGEVFFLIIQGFKNMLIPLNQPFSIQSFTAVQIAMLTDTFRLYQGEQLL